jgi:protein O-GlcNAc transferase
VTHASDPSRRCEEAVRLAESGSKREAEARLRALVAEGSRFPLACIALGVLCGERGDRTQRRLWFEQARLLEEASGQPLSQRLLLNLQVDALEAGEQERAEAYGRELLVHYPEDGEAHLQQARFQMRLGRLEEGISHLDRAVEALRARIDADSEDVKGWRLLASAEQQAGRHEQALEAYRQALALDPNHVPTLLAIGRLLGDRGTMEEAMPWLMNALAVAPDSAEVLCVNGIALVRLVQHEQAMILFRQALSIEPALAKASTSLALALNDQGMYEEAARVSREALTHNPNHTDCRLVLATSLRCMGDSAAALAIFQEVLEEDPDSLGAFCQWMFTTSISDVATPAEVLATARRFWSAQDREAAPQAPPIPATPRASGRPLRVGLLSADIGSHVVGWFLDSLLRHHDPARCQLELLSMKRRYESYSEALIAMAEGFHSLEGLPDTQARALMRERDYDLIVDTSGYTGGTGIHLLAERCAPVQAHYIGYHATTGLATIDAFIGDEETAAPELQEQFSERLWRLPRPWLAFPGHLEFPEATPLMQTERPVLGCFGQMGKISDATLAIWAEVLLGVPEALLVLKDKGLQDPDVRQRLQDRLDARGVAPGRLTFLAPVAGWHNHVDHYNLLDVALDTTPWSSATTGFEALGMGVPLVPIRGSRMASRMSSGLVRGLGRGEWIGDDSRAITAVVANLCANLPALREGKVRRQREALASPLFDGADLATKVTELFVAVVEAGAQCP